MNKMWINVINCCFIDGKRKGCKKVFLTFHICCCFLFSNSSCCICPKPFMNLEHHRDVREMRCGDVDWIHLDKISDSCDHGNKLLSALKTPTCLRLASQEPGQGSANLMAEMWWCAGGGGGYLTPHPVAIKGGMMSSRENRRNLEENLSQCYFAYRESHMKLHGTGPEAPRWEVSAWSPDLWGWKTKDTREWISEYICNKQTRNHREEQIREERTCSIFVLRLTHCLSLLMWANVISKRGEFF
jgi:hypothetical protein